MGFNRAIEILLVEDAPSDAERFRDVVNGDARLTVATTGAEALDRLFRRGEFHSHPRPNLIVLNDDAILEEIKSNSELRPIPVVVYRASDSYSDVSRAYWLGAAAYIRKSDDMREALREMTCLAEFWLRYAALPGVSQPEPAIGSGFF